MKEFILEMEALKYVLGLLQLLVSAWCYVIYSDLKQAKKDSEVVSKELSDHKLHTAESYLTKSEATRAFDALSRTLESLGATMNSRFDRTDSKLDSKMDKGE